MIYPVTVRVIWSKKRSHWYQNRFYRDDAELEGGLRWLDKMEKQRGAIYCIMPRGYMAPWIGCDGEIWLGRSGDVVTMLDDLARAA